MKTWVMRAVVGAVVLAGAGWAGAAAQQYLFVDLRPAEPRPFTRIETSYGSGVSGGGVVGNADVYDFTVPSIRSHAGFWAGGTAGGFVDLHPGAGRGMSEATGVSGSWQVGRGFSTATGLRALVWQGSAGSMVDLTPAGASSASAYGVAGQQIVGYDSVHGAVMWTGPDHTLVPLASGDIDSSTAFGTDGVQQVGSGSGPLTGGRSHALLWSGTAESVVDLTPSGFVSVRAVGVGEGQQVGYGYGDFTGGGEHALLWNGTAESIIDLHLPGFTRSQALATNGRQQVGFVQGPGIRFAKAVVWEGTPNDFTDLNAFLPAGYDSAIAYAIDKNGVIVGGASPIGGSGHAVMWIPVPEPTSGVGWGAGMLAVSLGSRRRRGLSSCR